MNCYQCDRKLPMVTTTDAVTNFTTSALVSLPLIAGTFLQCVYISTLNMTLCLCRLLLFSSVFPISLQHVSYFTTSYSDSVTTICLCTSCSSLAGSATAAHYLLLPQMKLWQSIGKGNQNIYNFFQVEMLSLPNVSLRKGQLNHQ